jgi:hypothetical protein
LLASSTRGPGASDILYYTFFLLHLLLLSFLLLLILLLLLLLSPCRYSDMVGGTVSSRRTKGGGVFNKLQARRGVAGGPAGRGDGDFTVRESGGTVRSIAGLRSGQVSEIMFVDKEREWPPSRPSQSCP